VDEQFGPMTEQATRDFQRTNGLAVDGIVGRNTRAAMARALSL
jgi:peptidoglycan hydrolase-like protein with peptidoglycan-binding domain